MFAVRASVEYDLAHQEERDGAVLVHTTGITPLLLKPVRGVLPAKLSTQSAAPFNDCQGLTAVLRLGTASTPPFPISEKVLRHG